MMVRPLYPLLIQIPWSNQLRYVYNKKGRGYHMSKFSEKFENGLIVVAEKVDNNKYLGAIKNAFTAFMPFIIVGSFASLFNTLICSTSTGLAAIVPAAAQLAPAFTAVNYATLSIMALPICYLIGLEMAKRNKVPEHIGAIISLCAFICVIPQTFSVTVEGLAEAVSGGGLPSAAIGAQGLFIAMFVSLLISELFAKLMKIDAIKIKMPPSVPTAISQSFNTLIPILICLLVAGIAGQVFFLATGTYMNDWIYSVVQAPLEALFQSPVGAIALFVAAQVFWFLGIHGNMIITPIRNPLIASALAANVAAAAAGHPQGQLVGRAPLADLPRPARVRGAQARVRALHAAGALRACAGRGAIRRKNPRRKLFHVIGT